MSKSRPVIITIICVLGFLITVGSFPMIFFFDTKNFGAWFTPSFILFYALQLITLVSLWKMKKWSVILFIILFAIVQMILVMLHSWSLGTLINPGIVLVILLSQFKKMD